MTRLLLFVVALLTPLIRSTYSLEQDFYLGVFRNAGQPSSLTLLITTQDNSTSSHVVIETIDKIIHSLTIQPQTSKEIILHENLTVTSSDYSQRHKGVHVHSTNEILITALSQNGDSSDAYQIYPIPALVEESVYYAITPSTSMPTVYSSQLLLISTNNDSLIRVKPTKDINITADLQEETDNSLRLVTAGSIYTGTLHKFQTLLFESMNDLTGSRITSSKPLVIISGHECAQFDSNSNCSFIAEQIPPINVWGQEFITSHLYLNSSHNYIIVSSNNDTSISQTCTNGTSHDITLHEEGQFYHANQPLICTIQSSSPILVALMYTGDHPLMTLVPPNEQYSSSVRLSSFSCATSDTMALLLNGTTSPLHNTSIIVQVPSTSSGVLFVSFENMLDYSQMDIDFGVIVYSIKPLCQFAYTVGWNLTQKVTAPPPSQVVATVYTFGTTQYTASESHSGTVDIVILKTNNINEQTSVVVTTNNTSSNNADFTIQNDIIIFDVGETRETLRINITDDDLVEPLQESYKISLISNTNQVIVSGEFVLTIIDDDSLSIGLNSLVYEPNTQLLSIEVGVNLGVLATNMSLGLIIRLQEWVLLDHIVEFTHELTAHVIKVNMSRTNTCSVNETLEDCMITSEILLQETMAKFNATLNPNKLNGTLSTFIESKEETCNYIIGEFTQQSLVIASCVSGILLILTILSTVMGIIGCGLSYHTRRKWTLGGGLNKLYFQDDGMSLATNDPETYELMNRLGEKQTAVLAINDDNEY